MAKLFILNDTMSLNDILSVIKGEDIWKKIKLNPTEKDPAKWQKE